MKNTFNYILSIFNPKGKDNGRDFLIKSIISTGIGIIICFLLTELLLFIFYKTNYNYNFLILILLYIIILFGLRIIVVIRRLNDIGASKTGLLLYFLLIITGFGFTYFLYLYFAKSNSAKKVEETTYLKSLKANFSVEGNLDRTNYLGFLLGGIIIYPFLFLLLSIFLTKFDNIYLYFKYTFLFIWFINLIIIGFKRSKDISKNNISFVVYLIGIILLFGVHFIRIYALIGLIPILSLIFIPGKKY